MQCAIADLWPDRPDQQKPVFVERAYRLAQPLYLDVRTVCSKDGEMERDARAHIDSYQDRAAIWLWTRELEAVDVQ